MAEIYSNEPYQRVSVENAPIDGAIVGMAAGGLGAGAFIGTTYHQMKSIPRKAERNVRRLNELNGELNRQEERLLERNFNRVKRLKEKDLSSASYDRKLRRIQKSHERELNRIQKRRDHYGSLLGQWTDSAYVNQRVQNTFYQKRKLSSGKNAIIVGASALLGTGLGAIVDEING